LPDDGNGGIGRACQPPVPAPIEAGEASMPGSRGRLQRVGDVLAETPGLGQLVKPLYRRAFERHRGEDNAYFGIYESFEQATAAAPATVVTGYDTDAAASLYDYRISKLESSDYPALFWLDRMLASGQRRIFDLGGHVGVGYYAFQQLLKFPDDLIWQVHDVPVIMTRGRELARERDPKQRLRFVELDEVDGCDVLMAMGSLQYLDYTLPELIRRQQTPPANLLINLTPMHPNRSFFTLQNIGVAVCPYRISAVPEFIFEVRALGYRLQERWDHLERQIRFPFDPDYSIDRYHGFYFCRE
jgi:putative methyltransferase (TIGR04325 family)